MRYQNRTILLTSLWFLLSHLAVAQTTVTPSPPSIDARAYILQDHDSGRVLAEKNADEKMEPASLTKIMTAYVAFAELRQGTIALDDMVRVSEKAWRMQGSRMFIEVDTQVSVEDLLMGVIVQSGNDASVALAEHVTGSEEAFAALMNQHAARLGMTGSHFVNSTGLPDPDLYVTARDLATLAHAIIQDFPEYYEWHAVREYVFNDITQRNRNKLLWRDDSVDGIKTGYTSSAGYCLVASSKRDGMRLTSAVLGSKSTKSRAKQSASLLAFGFRFFETRRLYGAQETVEEVRVWKGQVETLGIGLADDLYITVPRGRFDSLRATMEVDEQIIAPVAKGDPRGTVKLTLGEDDVAERPLIALQSVDEGNVWQQLVDQVRLYFN